jgi:hypothetical protein
MRGALEEEPVKGAEEEDGRGSQRVAQYGDPTPILNTARRYWAETLKGIQKPKYQKKNPCVPSA